MYDKSRLKPRFLNVAAVKALTVWKNKIGVRLFDLKLERLFLFATLKLAAKYYGPYTLVSVNRIRRRVLLDIYL